MADPLPTNTEIPKFDTHPARSGSEDTFASPGSRTYMPGTSGSTGAVTADHLLDRGALAKRAAQFGSVVGRTVARVRRRRGKVLVMKPRSGQSVSSGNLKDRVDELKSSARNLGSTAQQRTSQFVEDARSRAAGLTRIAQHRLSEFADQARERTSAWRGTARLKTVELRERAINKYYDARLNTQEYVNSNPLQALAIIGGAAAVLGATIRIVRSRNAERI